MIIFLIYQPNRNSSFVMKLYIQIFEHFPGNQHKKYIRNTFQFREKHFIVDLYNYFCSH